VIDRVKHLIWRIFTASTVIPFSFIISLPVTTTGFLLLQALFK
jgi:hypothetical protein